MRTNGMLYPLVVTEPGKGAVTYTQRGVPIVSNPTPAYGTPIECWAQTNVDEATGAYEDGEFRRCAFTVFIEGTLDSRRVKLVKDGEDLGEFRAIQVERLSRMGRTKIMLRQ